MDKEEAPSDLKIESTPITSKNKVSWGPVSMSLLAILFSAYALFANQRTAIQLRTHARENSIQKPADELHHLQTMLDKISQSTEQLSQQVSTNTQHIQTLLHNQPQLAHDQDWQIKTARHYLELAQINSKWTYNVPATIALLKQADDIFAQIPSIDQQTARQAIAQDVLMLEQLPVIDVGALLTKIKLVQKQIHTLPLVPHKTVTPTSPTPSKSPVPWREQLQESLQQLRGLVAIHHQSDAIETQLGPYYIVLLQERIRMNLQQAEMGLMTQQQKVYDSALESAIDTICHSFDVNDAKTQAILHVLQSLQQSKISQNKITLSDYTKIFDHETAEKPETAAPQNETPS